MLATGQTKYTIGKPWVTPRQRRVQYLPKIYEPRLGIRIAKHPTKERYAMYFVSTKNTKREIIGQSDSFAKLFNRLLAWSDDYIIY